MMAGRRTDTRERIQQVALELFAERGYEKTTLREVAERLRITRPALYYHFKAKEEILVGIMEDLMASVDDLVEWAGDQAPTVAARYEILRRIAELLEDQWRPLIRFAQVNQAAMRELPIGDRMSASMMTLLSVLRTGDGDPVRQFEAQLAVIALIIGSAPFPFDVHLPDGERSITAMKVAQKLVSGEQPPE
ncbi:MAG TPA: helix-turn-helix domain-containing protein [Nonomuraea sp.]|nr:helix-turn-helix domain-containing protein [Nonomuraea sp.]